MFISSIIDGESDEQILFRCYSQDNGSDADVQRVNSFVERSFDEFLVDFGESAFVGLDDTIDYPVQTAAKHQVVIRVGK